MVLPHQVADFVLRNTYTHTYSATVPDSFWKQKKMCADIIRDDSTNLWIKGISCENFINNLQTQKLPEDR